MDDGGGVEVEELGGCRAEGALMGSVPMAKSWRRVNS